MNTTTPQAPTDARCADPSPIAYSVADAVKVSGIGRTTLYALMGSGILPSVKMGSRRLIRRLDLDQLLSINVICVIAINDDQ